MNFLLIYTVHSLPYNRFLDGENLVTSNFFEEIVWGLVWEPELTSRGVRCIATWWWDIANRFCVWMCVCVCARACACVFQDQGPTTPCARKTMHGQSMGALRHVSWAFALQASTRRRLALALHLLVSGKQNHDSGRPKRVTICGKIKKLPWGYRSF